MNLSSKVLILTVIFVMLAELLIYIPSIARFRKTYLIRQLDNGHLASLTLEATPDRMVDDRVRKALLAQAGVLSVVINQEGARYATLPPDMPPMIDDVVDLEQGGWAYWITGAFDSLLAGQERILRVKGVSAQNPSVRVEISLEEVFLREAMLEYSARILQLSLLISGLTGALLFLALQWLMIRPMRRLTRAMETFHESPEESVYPAPISNRSDEIGTAEREFFAMRDTVRTALRQQASLAALGGAMAKINHDLRASLATVFLVSDRLDASEDPEVREIAPRIYESIGRAVDLCSQTLDYARLAKIRPQLELINIADLLDEVSADLIIFGEGKLTCKVQVDPLLELEADPRQIQRALSNLGRNAAQAGATQLLFSGEASDDFVIIRIADNGPGMSTHATDNLFTPFAAADRQEGTGLGLVIALEIARAHSGNLDLESTGGDGTIFALKLPRPAP